jgi:putative spermidine/putrescine transport system permease protein
MPGGSANAEPHVRPARRPDPDRGPGLRRALLVLPGLFFLTALFLYPLGALVVTSVQGGDGFTAVHYRRLFGVPTYSRVLLNTLWTAGLVTAVCLVLGYPVAYRLATAGPRGKAFLLAAILVPFWTSLLVRAYGWMVILHPRGLLNTWLGELGLIGAPLALVQNTLGVLIGMSQVMLPYMILPVAAVMEGIDPRLVQAARSLGASPWRAFLRVFLPLSLPGVLAGTLLVFIISLGFFVIPALLGGTRDILLAQLIHFHINTVLNWEFAAALATVLLATTLLVYAVLHRWFGLGALWGEGR